MMIMCFRRISAAASVRRVVSVRGGGVCRLHSAAWRHRHTVTDTPVNVCGRLKEPPVSCSWVFRINGSDSRIPCWSGIFQRRKVTLWHAQGTVLSLCRGLHERSVASFRSLQSSKARGLCSGNPKETPGGSPTTNRKETSSVPGQGLFKFKELVSTDVSDRCIGLHWIMGKHTCWTENGSSDPGQQAYNC